MKPLEPGRGKKKTNEWMTLEAGTAAMVAEATASFQMNAAIYLEDGRGSGAAAAMGGMRVRVEQTRGGPGVLRVHTTGHTQNTFLHGSQTSKRRLPSRTNKRERTLTSRNERDTRDVPVVK